MQQTLAYINDGRGGTVVYKDNQSELKFSFEFGGGNCVAIIFVPAIDEWTRITKRAIEDRPAILTFVAEQAIRDQVPGGFFQLSDNCIEIFNTKTF